MGFLSKISGADRTGRGLAKLDLEVEDRSRQGLPEFTLTIRDTDFAGPLSGAIPRVVTHLQDSGYGVLGVETEWETQQAYIRVKNRPNVSELRSSGPEPQPGTDALTMGPDALIELEAWMAETFRLRTTEAAHTIWLTRLRLGYEIPTGLPQHVTFWLHAYPALCANILNMSGEFLPEPSLAVVCADQAQQTVDETNKSQVSAAEHVRNLLH